MPRPYSGCVRFLVLTILTKKKLGLLINFNSAALKDGITRVIL